MEQIERKNNKYELRVQGIPAGCKDIKYAINHVMHSLLEIRDFKHHDLRDSRFLPSKSNDKTKTMVLDFISYENRSDILSRCKNFGKNKFEGKYSIRITPTWTMKQKHELDATLAVRKACEIVNEKFKGKIMNSRKLETHGFNMLCEPKKQKHHYTFYKGKLIEVVKENNCYDEYKEFFSKIANREKVKLIRLVRIFILFY